MTARLWQVSADLVGMTPAAQWFLPAECFRELAWAQGAGVDRWIRAQSQAPQLTVFRAFTGGGVEQPVAHRDR